MFLPVLLIAASIDLNTDVYSPSWNGLFAILYL